MDEHSGLRVVSLGVDLIELPRVRAALARWGERLERKLMGDAERARLPAGAAARALAVGQAIVAKEAASKAIGTGWSRGVRWRDVVLLPGAALRLEARALEFARRAGSSGAARVRIERRGKLLLGEVRLLG